MHFLLAVYFLGQFDVAKHLRLSSSHYDSTLRVLSLQALTPWKEAVFTPYSTRLLHLFDINNWSWTNYLFLEEELLYQWAMFASLLRCASAIASYAFNVQNTTHLYVFHPCEITQPDFKTPALHHPLDGQLEALTSYHAKASRSWLHKAFVCKTQTLWLPFVS